MHYGNIKTYDIADGTGVRVSLFVSGCRNHCKNCFNPETWDFAYGREFTEETMQEILKALDHIYIAGFSLLGGEPFEQENQETLVDVLRKIKTAFPKKNIWCYTGYLLDVDLQPGGRKYTEFTEEMLSYIDILVDGRFVEEEKDITLQFRGSRNQRIFRLEDGKAVEKLFES